MSPDQVMARSEKTTVDLLHDNTLLLWVGAIVFFGAGDVITTIFGLSFQPVAEVGPIVEIFIHEFGMIAIIFLKIGAFILGYLLWRVTPAPHNTGVPLGLSSLGVLVTGWNLIIIIASM